jgi:hypothetical protein
MKNLKTFLIIAITATWFACGNKKEKAGEDTNNVPTDTDTVHLRADTVVVDTTIME